jgi:hypothetical protein
MMLPNQSQQSEAFMRAQGAPSVAQAVNGLTDAARQAIQAARTERHAMDQTEQNFGPRVPEHAARNTQQARAEEQSERYRMALRAAGLVDYTSLMKLGRLLSQG